ncbi:MAG TPA: pyrroline-5-carboxylate reductase, partial [Planctomycetia bacterium]|nr:pyrroline-5-carboxylate reductase [Planctomycetia bacterium]
MSVAAESDLRLGFLGAGQMARALAGGFLRSGLARTEDVCASDPTPAARLGWEEITGGKAFAANLEVVQAANVLFLCVKPQAMPALLAEIAPAVTEKHLVVSIAAGVTLAQMEAGLGKRRIVRVMPNTPALVGAAAAGISGGAAATAADLALVSELFDAVGVAAVVPEKLLDAVTGLSGSGPAYVFLMIEALADGGVKAGLPRDVAQKFAAQTVLGAAKMTLETGKHPGELKDQVASPAGTTIAGLAALERAGAR